MFCRTPSHVLEFCRMQNQVWMIEFSYECDFMLHNAWLDIVFYFFLLKWLVINIPEGGLSDLPVDESSYSVKKDLSLY